MTPLRAVATARILSLVDGTDAAGKEPDPMTTATEILCSTLSPADQSALRADRDEQLSERGHIDELVAEVAAAYPAVTERDTVISAEEWRKALLAL